jgi:hypothetical protein
MAKSDRLRLLLIALAVCLWAVVGVTATAAFSVGTPANATTYLSTDGCPPDPAADSILFQYIDNAVKPAAFNKQANTYYDRKLNVDISVAGGEDINLQNNATVNLWSVDFVYGGPVEPTNAFKAYDMHCIASTNAVNGDAKFNGTVSVQTNSEASPAYTQNMIFAQVVDNSDTYEPRWGDRTYTPVDNGTDQIFELTGSPDVVYQILNFARTMLYTNQNPSNNEDFDSLMNDMAPNYYNTTYPQGASTDKKLYAAEFAIDLFEKSFDYYNFSGSLFHMTEPSGTTDFSEQIQFTKKREKDDATANQSLNTSYKVGDVFTLTSAYVCTDTATSKELTVVSSGSGKQYRVGPENYNHQVSCVARNDYSIYQHNYSGLSMVRIGDIPTIFSYPAMASNYSHERFFDYSGTTYLSPVESSLNGTADRWDYTAMMMNIIGGFGTNQDFRDITTDYTNWFLNSTGNYCVDNQMGPSLYCLDSAIHAVTTRKFTVAQGPGQGSVSVNYTPLPGTSQQPLVISNRLSSPGLNSAMGGSVVTDDIISVSSPQVCSDGNGANCTPAQTDAGGTGWQVSYKWQITDLAKYAYYINGQTSSSISVQGKYEAGELSFSDGTPLDSALIPTDIDDDALMCVQMNFHYLVNGVQTNAYPLSNDQVCSPVSKNNLDITPYIGWDLSPQNIPRVGETQVAVLNTSDMPSGWTCNEFQWASDSDTTGHTPLDGQTNIDHLATEDDYNKYLSASVTCTKPGYSNNNTKWTQYAQVGQGVGQFSDSTDFPANIAHLAPGITTEHTADYYQTDDVLAWVNLPTSSDPEWAPVCKKGDDTLPECNYTFTGEEVSQPQTFTVQIIRKSGNLAAWVQPSSTFTITPKMGTWRGPKTLTWTPGFSVAQVDKALIPNENQTPDGWTLNQSTWQWVLTKDGQPSSNADPSRIGTQNGYQYYTPAPQDEGWTLTAAVGYSLVGWNPLVFTSDPQVIAKGDPTEFKPSVLGVLKLDQIVTVISDPSDGWTSVSCSAYIVSNPNLKTAPTTDADGEFAFDCTHNTSWEVSSVNGMNAVGKYLMFVQHLTKDHYNDAQNVSVQPTPVLPGDEYSDPAPRLCSGSGCDGDNIRVNQQVQVVGLPDQSLGWTLSNCSFEISDDNVQWRNLQDISPCTVSTASILTTANLVGKYLRFKWTVSKLGHPTTENKVTAAAQIQAETPIELNPTLNGTMQVGEIITVAGVPSGSSGWSNFIYTFECVKSNIPQSAPKQDGPITYLPLTADWVECNVKITVTATQGGSQTSGTSTSAEPVLLGVIPDFLPTIVGTPSVGQTLVAVLSEPGYTITATEWYGVRNEQSVRLSNSSTYEIPPDAEGEQIIASVSFGKHGYSPDTRESAATSAVSLGTIPSFTPTLSATPTFGHSLWVTNLLQESNFTSTVQIRVQDAGGGNDTIVQDGDSNTFYTPQVADVGKLLYAQVTVTAPGYTTSTVETAKATVQAATLPNPPVPQVSGTAKVDHALEVLGIPSGWTVTKHEWFWTDNLVTPLKSTTALHEYIIKPTDLNKFITSTVTLQRAGFQDLVLHTTSTAKILPDDVPDYPVALFGNARVGAELQILGLPDASAGFTVGVEWHKLSGGVDTLLPETSRKYTPLPADLGAQIYAKVTVSKVAYTTRVFQTDPTAPVAPGASIDFAPEIQGSAYFEGLLHAAYFPDPTSGWSNSFSWYISATPPRLEDGLTGAVDTTSSISPPLDSVGKYLVLRITSTRPGYTSTTKQVVSPIIAKHAALPFLPYIVGERRVGETMQVEGEPSTSLGFALAYTWTADGEVRTGADTEFYTPYSHSGVDSDYSKKVCATITATKPGWEDAVAETDTDCTSGDAVVGLGDAPVYEAHITGVPKIDAGGLTVQVSPDYTPEIADPQFTYAWLRNDSSTEPDEDITIGDQSDESYTLDADADPEKYIAASVIVQNYGYASATLKTPYVGPVSNGSPLTLAPTLSDDTPEVGDTLTVLGLPDPALTGGWQVSSITWYIDGVPEPVGRPFLNITADMLGKQIYAVVVAQAHGMVDTSAQTNTSTPVAQGAFTASLGWTCEVTCETPKVGETIYLSGLPSGYGYTYSWGYASDEGSAPLDATSEPYHLITPTDLGKELQVVVTITRCKAGYICPPTVTSPPSKTVAQGDTTEQVPQIQGSAMVGEELSLTGLPAGWHYADGYPEWYIMAGREPSTEADTLFGTPGVTSATIPPDAADKAVYAVVKLQRPGYADTEEMVTVPTAAVHSSDAYNDFAPEVDGCQANCRYLMTTTVSGLPEGFTYTYSWETVTAQDDTSGTVVSTDSAYTLQLADIGKYIRVRVTATKPGYDVIVKVSAAKSVQPARVDVSALRLCTKDDIPEVGKVVSVCGIPQGSWTETYSWQTVNPPSGVLSTANFYEPTAADQGAEVVATVVLAAPGFSTVQAEVQFVFEGDKTVQPGAPIDFNPEIDGVPEVGNVLWAQNIPDSSTGWTPSYSWTCGGDETAESVTDFVQIQPDWLGKTLTLEVTLTKPGHEPSVKSVTATTVVIKGAPIDFAPEIVWDTSDTDPELRIYDAVWVENLPTVGDAFPYTFTYCWFWSGDASPNACSVGTDSEFTLSTSSVGKQLQVKVTARRTGYEDSIATSAPTPAVASGGHAANTLVLDGDPAVWSRINVERVPDFWAEDRISFIQFDADDEPETILATVQNPDDLSYQIMPESVGHKIRVELELSRPGFDDTTLVIDTPVVVPGQFRAWQPLLTAPVRVGDPISFTGTPNGSTVVGFADPYSPEQPHTTQQAPGVQWFRGNLPIPGANSLTYTPTHEDLGAGLSVRVEVEKDGYSNDTETSAAVSVDFGEQLRNFAPEMLQFDLGASATSSAQVEYQIVGLPEESAGYTISTVWFIAGQLVTSDYPDFAFGPHGPATAVVTLNRAGYRPLTVTVGG